MESIDNDKAGATTASYSCDDYAHKNHVSPFPPYSPVTYIRRALEGTREQLGAGMDQWFPVVPSGLQAHASLSTGLYCLGASAVERCVRRVSVGLQSLRSCYSVENGER